MTKFSSKINIEEGASFYEEYCDGYKSPAPNGKGYFVTPVLSVGKVPIKYLHPGSQLLDNILAYDKAETTSAYIGQINMTTVSSFVGLNGVVWGYDLARPRSLKKHHNLAPKQLKENNRKIPIYNLEPLEKASKELFGTIEEKHFPFIPGSHVPCAGKYITKKGPKEIYGVMAIGIPENRSESAALIMEDVGELIGENKQMLKEKILTDISESVLGIGKIQNIKYKEIFVNIKSIKLKEDEMGCAMVVMPYFYLAKNAYLGDSKKMANISLEQWKRKVKNFFLK